MGKPLALSSGTILQRSAGGVIRRTAQAAAAQGQLAVSYYDLKQDPYVDLVAGHVRPQTGAVVVSGSNWRTQDLYENNMIDLDGTILSLPAGATKIDANEILWAGFGDYPAYFTGRTLVMERRQGKFKGAGNSMNIFQIGATLSNTTWEFEQNSSGDGATTTFAFTGVNAGGENWSADQIHVYVGGYRKQHKMKAGTDYAVAANGNDIDVTFTSAPASGTDNIFFLLHRREFELDTANWGTTPPRDAGPFPTYGIGTPSAVQDCMLASIFWKDEEADFRARFDTPRKMFAPWFRSYYSFANVIRPMDLYNPMRSSAAVPADMAEIDDATINGHSDTPLAVFDYAFNGALGTRQSNPTLPLLDLCKNEYASVRTPWLVLPVTIGMPFVQSTYYEHIQSGGSDQTGYAFMNPNVIDVTKTITLSNETNDGVPAPGIASIDPSNKRLIFDGSGYTHLQGDPEVEFAVDVDFTDVKGVAKTYRLAMRVIATNEGGDGYRWWHKTSRSWEDNESYYDNHWAWEEWADWLLDQLEAAGWSSTDEILLELGNEVWNTAEVFNPSTGFPKGLAVIKSLGGEHNLTGHGWIYGKLKKNIDDRMAARSLNYNITLAVGTWTSWGLASVTNQKLSGLKQYWESAEGGSLSGQALLDKQAEAQIFITNYYSSPFVNDRNRNYTVLQDRSVTRSGDGAATLFTVPSGAGATASQCTVTVDGNPQTPDVDFTVADNGDTLEVTFAVAPPSGSNNVAISHTAHTDKVAADFAADEDNFWNNLIYGYYAATGPGTDDLTRIIWIENRYDDHQAKAQEYNTICRGCYEGGSHDDDAKDANISSSIRNIAGFEASYESNMQGALGAGLWNLMVSRLRAKDPNLMIAAYGGPYDWTFPQAWAYGAYQTTKNAYATAIENTGITE